METTASGYGLVGSIAPELDIERWVDGAGKVISPVKLADYAGKFKVLYCFQSWCPGCHSAGLPSLQKMVDALAEDDKVAFLAIQSVFEGHESNTYEKMLEVQKKYDLHIPFGQDEGNAGTGNIATTMRNYRTGGTPWFIFIDQDDRVVFNEFHLDPDKAIDYLRDVTSQEAA